jgi:hypothetical protein
MSYARDIEDLEMPTGFRDALCDLERVSLNQIWEDVRKETAAALEDAGWVKEIEGIARESVAAEDGATKKSEEDFASFLAETKFRDACQSIPAGLKKRLLEYISSLVLTEAEEPTSRMSGNEAVP